MTYVVINGTKRQQFESIKEASAFMGDGSKLYLIDGFGNLSPLGNDSIEMLLKNETPIQKENEQSSVSAKENADLQSAVLESSVKHSELSQKPVSQEPLAPKVVIVQKVQSEENLLFRGLVFIVVVLIILFFVYMILKPYLEEFQVLNGIFF